MGHPFHYFFPGRLSAEVVPGGIAKRAVFDSLNLGYLADRWKKPNQVSYQDARIDSHQGAFLTPTVKGQPARQIGYDQAKQGWLKTGKVWIGWELDELPTPELFVRPSPISGYDIKDDGDRVWMVPIARSPAGRGQIPNDIMWDESGEPVKVRKASFDWLWKLAGEVWDYWNASSSDADPSWVYKVALQCLQVNYQIGRLELNAFQSMGKSVIDERFATLVTLALIDMEIVEKTQEVKKNEEQLTPS